jgi:hypothetical protein
LTNKFTKDVHVFDRGKVGVGDIVEFNEYSRPLIGNPKLLYKRVGIVEQVGLETLWVRTQDSHFQNTTEKFGLPVNRANELRMVYRSVLNVKEGEPYGEEV